MPNALPNPGDPHRNRSRIRSGVNPPEGPGCSQVGPIACKALDGLGRLDGGQNPESATWPAAAGAFAHVYAQNPAEELSQGVTPRAGRGLGLRHAIVPHGDTHLTAGRVGCEASRAGSGGGRRPGRAARRAGPEVTQRVGLAVGVPGDPDIRRRADRPDASPSLPRDGRPSSRAAGPRSIRQRQTRDLPHVPALLRHASAGRRVRHPDDSWGTATCERR